MIEINSNFWKEKCIKNDLNHKNEIKKYKIELELIENENNLLKLNLKEYEQREKRLRNKNKKLNEILKKFNLSSNNNIKLTNLLDSNYFNNNNKKIKIVKIDKGVNTDNKVSKEFINKILKSDKKIIVENKLFKSKINLNRNFLKQKSDIDSIRTINNYNKIQSYKDLKDDKMSLDTYFRKINYSVLNEIKNNN